LVRTHGGPGLILAGSLVLQRERIPNWLGAKLVKGAQRRAEKLHARMRRDLLKMDKQLGTALAFAGRKE